MSLIEAVILAQSRYPAVLSRLTYDERERRNCLEMTDPARGVRISRFLRDGETAEQLVEAAYLHLCRAKPLDGRKPRVGQLSLF